MSAEPSTANEATPGTAPPTATPLKRSGTEVIKESSQALRGDIAEELQQDTPKFNDQNKQLLKFHGTYQQEDRDARKARRAEGLGKHYMFMVRCKIPGGRVTADQYLAARRPGRQARQRHAAHHHAAGHPVPRRPQGQPEGDHRRHQHLPADHAGGLRRRGTQRHGLPRPAPARRGPRGAAGDRRPPRRSPGAAHRRLSRNLAQRQGGVSGRARTGKSSRSTARSICRASSRPAWHCRKTIASTFTPRTSACWPSSRTAASSATTCWSAAAWA